MSDLPHTPTPFKLQQIDNNHHGYEGWETFAIRDAKTNGCLLIVGGIDRQFQDVDRGNAEFILKACNNFEAIEKALVDAESALFYAHIEVEFDTLTTKSQVSQALDAVRLMLEKLHEKEVVTIEGG